MLTLVLALAAPANADETVVFGHDTQITLAHRAFGVYEGGSSVGLMPVEIDGVHLLVSDPVPSGIGEGLLGSGWIGVASPATGESVTLLIDETISLEDVGQALALSELEISARVLPGIGGDRLAVSLDADGEAYLVAATSLGVMDPTGAPVLTAFGFYQDTGSLHVQAMDLATLGSYGAAAYEDDWIVPMVAGTMDLAFSAWSAFEKNGHLFLNETTWAWAGPAGELSSNLIGWPAFSFPAAPY